MEPFGIPLDAPVISGIMYWKERSEQLMGKTMEEIGEILFPEMDVEARNAVVDEFGEAVSPDARIKDIRELPKCMRKFF